MGGKSYAENRRAGFCAFEVDDLRLLRSHLFQWLSYDLVMLCLLTLISKPCHGCPLVALDILFPS